MQKTFDKEGSQQRQPVPRKRSTPCAKHRRRPAQLAAVAGMPAALRAARAVAPHEVSGGDATSARILPRCHVGAESSDLLDEASRAPAPTAEPAWCWQRPKRRKRGGCGR